VISGETAAGGIASDLCDNEPDMLHSGLRILCRTPALPPHGLAVHPRVPPEAGVALTRAVTALARDADGRRLLADAGPGTVAADYNRDYQAIEAMGLEKFDKR